MIGAAPRVASWHWFGWALALLVPIGVMQRETGEKR